jgi:non-ribosomal peptide synthetase component F
MFTTLLTTVYAFLYKISGQTDIVVGTPVAGRDHPDIQSLVGNCLNTLALRARFDEDVNFSSLSVIVKKIMLDAFQNRFYPFDKLIQDLGIDRNLSRSPLFDSMVVMNNVALADEQMLDHLQVSAVKLNSSFNKYDLVFSFTECADTIQCEIECNLDLFDYNSVLFFKEFYVNLLTAMLLTDIDTSINAIFAAPEKTDYTMPDFDFS